MEFIRCQMCGGSIDVIDNKAVCSSCGKIYTREQYIALGGVLEPQADERLALAKSACESKNRKLAEQYYNSYLNDYPRDPEALMLRGKCIGDQSTLLKIRFTEALADIKSAVAFQPDYNLRFNYYKEANEMMLVWSRGLANLMQKQYELPISLANLESFVATINQGVEAIRGLKEITSNEENSYEQMMVLMNYEYSVALKMWEKYAVGEYMREWNKNKFYPIFLDKATVCLAMISQIVGMANIKSNELAGFFKDLKTIWDECYRTCPKKCRVYLEHRFSELAKSYLEIDEDLTLEEAYKRTSDRFQLAIVSLEKNL